MPKKSALVQIGSGILWKGKGTKNKTHEVGSGITFSRPNRRSLSGKEGGRDFSSLELVVPMIESPKRLNASCD